GSTSPPECNHRFNHPLHHSDESIALNKKIVCFLPPVYVILDISNHMSLAVKFNLAFFTTYSTKTSQFSPNSNT
ncbi:hypothetical protein ACLBSM_32915, partial [Klebsiella pneumoniae]